MSVPAGSPRRGRSTRSNVARRCPVAAREGVHMAPDVYWLRHESVLDQLPDAAPCRGEAATPVTATARCTGLAKSVRDRRRRASQAARGWPLSRSAVEEHAGRFVRWLESWTLPRDDLR